MKCVPLLALVFLAAAPAVAAGQSVALDTVSDPEAYSVYTAVLATGWPKPDIPRGMVALEEKTIAHPPCPGWNQSPGSDWQPVVQAYVRENVTPHRLSSGLDLGVSYTLVTAEKFDDLIMIAAGDPERVYADFWGGMSLALSVVGFNPTKTRAAASLQYACPKGCGGGRAFLLQKQNGRWELATEDRASCTWTDQRAGAGR